MGVYMMQESEGLMVKDQYCLKTAQDKVFTRHKEDLFAPEIRRAENKGQRQEIENEREREGRKKGRGYLSRSGTKDCL